MRAFKYLFLVTLAYSELATLTNDNYTQVSKIENPEQNWLLYYTGASRNEELETGVIDAANHVKTNRMKYSIINCVEQPTICEKHNVTTYPDVRYFDNGTPKDYDWTLDADGLYKIGHKITNPSVFNLGKDKTFNRFKENHDNSFILWFFPMSQDSTHLQKVQLFDKVAREYRHTPFYFGQAVRAELRAAERIPFAAMPVVRMYGIDEAYDYNVTHYSEESLRRFIEDHKFGHVFALDHTQWRVVHRDLKKQKKVLLIAVVDLDDDDQVQKFISHLRVSAWDNRVAENFNFQMAFLDFKMYPELAAEYGVTEAPALLAVDFRSGTHTVAPKGFQPNVRVELTRFMLNVWNNRTTTEAVKQTILEEEEKEEEEEVIQIQSNPDAMKNYAIMGVALIVFFIASIKMCASPPTKSEPAQAKKAPAKSTKSEPAKPKKAPNKSKKE